MLKIVAIVSFSIGVLVGAGGLQSIYSFTNFFHEKKIESAVSVAIEDYKKSDKENAKLDTKLEKLKNEARSPNCTLSKSDVSKLR